MATTVNSDMKIYPALAQTAYLERMQDVLGVFNAASGGSILLRNERIEGDFSKNAFYKIGGAIEHRDVNSTGAIVSKKISAGEMVGVKVPFKYGPYSATEESFKRRARTVEEFSVLVGRDYADAVLAGYIEFSLAGLTAAIGSNPAMIASASITTDGKKALTKGFRAFGDRFNRIGVWVMDSASYLDLVDQSIDNKIFNEADVVVYGGQVGTMGKPVLVTDKAPANTIFGLQAGALTVTESQLPGFRAYDVNDQENLAVAIRGEGTFNLDILGYSWAESAGANPTLAAIGASANWTKYANSDKMTAGVRIDLT